MNMYKCKSCGYGSSSWYGRCPECSAWGSFELEQGGSKQKSKIAPAQFVSINKITTNENKRKSTGIYEFDRVLGGGFVKGEVVLVAGEPGVGKSTLLLSALQGLNVLYISGEESAEQIKHRSDRINAVMNRFDFSDSINIESILKALKRKHKAYDVLVVDSIQTVYSSSVQSSTGSVVQIRETTSQLVDFAKAYGLIVIIVGHVTKGGDIAGPKTLEHIVDCVVYLEGEESSQFRIMRSHKNRYGSTREVGVFEMTQKGLIEMKNPTKFINDELSNTQGRSIVGVAEGSRTLFYEVQNLVVSSYLVSPRRVVSGLDYNRTQLLLAVARKYLHLPLDKFDIYTNVVGGVTIKSTSSDLGVIASVMSSIKGLQVPSKSVFVGEVGLLGEVRSAIGQKKIIRDAKRYGFSKVYCSDTIKTIVDLKRKIK